MSNKIWGKYHVYFNGLWIGEVWAKDLVSAKASAAQLWPAMAAGLKLIRGK